MEQTDLQLPAMCRVLTNLTVPEPQKLHSALQDLRALNATSVFDLKLPAPHLQASKVKGLCMKFILRARWGNMLHY